MSDDCVGALGIPDSEVEAIWHSFRGRATLWTPETAPYDFAVDVNDALAARLRDAEAEIARLREDAARPRTVDTWTVERLVSAIEAGDGSSRAWHRDTVRQILALLNIVRAQETRDDA